MRIELITPDASLSKEIEDYKREMLEAGSSMDGCGSLRRQSAEEWLAFNQTLLFNPPENLVKSTQFVALFEGRIVGMIQVRHTLNEYLTNYAGHIGYSVRPSARRKGVASAMLKAVLPFCRQIGLTWVGVSCKTDNEGSRRTILKNGGRYEDTVFEPKVGRFLERYRIYLEETMKEALKVYDKTNKKLKALGLSFFLEGWDSIFVPAASVLARSPEMETLSELSYELATDSAYEGAIETLYANREELSDVLKHEIVEKYKSVQNLKKIPKEEYVSYQALLARLYPKYVECKAKGDFDSFEPELDKIFDYLRKEAKWLETEEKKGYDVLLDEYEPGMTKAEYDAFFAKIKERLVPFIAEVLKKKLSYRRDFTKKTYPVEGQKKYVAYLRKVMGFDETKTVIAESEHPFTTNFGREDVRITVHYYEDNLASFLFSAVHEMGHGLYEMQVSPDLDVTMSGGGASMAMHESQSRFMENMIARSFPFVKTHFPALKECFPEQLEGVTVEDFYAYVNEVQAGFIRTEADELTYPLHVLIRYEIEREVIENGLSARQARALWNEKYKDYLGLTVENDREGVLQDVHWSQGSVGYFPTYALGSAYAAQFYRAMEKEIDVEKAISSGTLAEISAWNKEHIHKYGASKYPKEIVRLATGEEFNPDYYVDYLIEKYKKLYAL